MTGTAAPAQLRTGQVAELAGVNIQTLRYYERRGLIAEPERSLGGHRLYPESTVTQVKVIKAAQRLGFSLADIAHLISAGRPGHPTPDLQAHARAKIEEIDARVADLMTIRRSLAQVVAARCDSLDRCTCADCPLPFAELVHREPE
ncbi:MerR family transcriptional regulator [Nocardiopsis nanhaiensis]